MAATEAVEFLIKDHGDKKPPSGFRKDFAEDKPYRSILQRNDDVKSLDDILDLFNWKDDSDEWLKEYKGDKNMNKMVMYRRRASFCVGGWREFNEDFGRGDVSCLRDVRTPLVTSRTPLRAMKDDFDVSE